MKNKYVVGFALALLLSLLIGSVAYAQSPYESNREDYGYYGFSWWGTYQVARINYQVDRFRGYGPQIVILAPSFQGAGANVPPPNWPDDYDYNTGTSSYTPNVNGGAY